MGEYFSCALAPPCDVSIKLEQLEEGEYSRKERIQSWLLLCLFVRRNLIIKLTDFHYIVGIMVSIHSQFRKSQGHWDKLQLSSFRYIIHSTEDSFD